MTNLEVDYKLSPFRLVSHARRERKLTTRKQWPREILWAGLGARGSRLPPKPRSLSHALLSQSKNMTRLC